MSPALGKSYTSISFINEKYEPAVIKNKKGATIMNFHTCAIFARQTTYNVWGYTREEDRI